MLEIRNGIPDFARRVRAGEPSTIVAFGTSLTAGGHYLAPFVAALDPNVTLVNCGVRGFCTYWAAFRVRADVLPHRPDLVFIEFAHNDVSESILEHCVPALEGIMAQIREANPACEFVFVYLAGRDEAAAGPTPAMRIYEEVAAHYGIPSIDLATLTEQLVADRIASWAGDGAPTLTVDGVHHAPIVEQLLGVPFADAFAELLRASTGARQPDVPIRDRSLANAWLEPASRYIATGTWGRGALGGEISKFPAYTENVAVANRLGGTLRIPFTGTRVFAWLMGAGPVSIEVAGRPDRHEVSVGTLDRWIFHPLTPLMEPGNYVLEASPVKAPVMFGDLYFLGP